MNTKEIPDLSLFRHHCPGQIRFNDIDILGHLNNTVYFSLYDTGKAYYMKDVRGPKMDFRRVDTVIANIDCAYIHSIVFGDEIDVYTRCVSIHEKSFVLEQMLVRRPDKLVMSICRTVMVSFDPAAGCSTPLGEDWKTMLQDYEQRPLVVAKQ